MPRVFIIMGDRGVRKTSTIRALTGVHKCDEWDVATGDLGIIKIYVHLSAIQEKKKTPEVFIRENGNHENILVPLWIKKGYKYPAGIEYIQKFIDAGWTIGGVVVLNKQNLPNSDFLDESQLHFILGSKNMPSNQIASQIRSWWGWL